LDSGDIAMSITETIDGFSFTLAADGRLLIDDVELPALEVLGLWLFLWLTDVCARLQLLEDHAGCIVSAA